MLNTLKTRFLQASINPTWSVTRQVGAFKRTSIAASKVEGLQSLRTTIEEGKELTPADWKALRQKIIVSNRNITEVNVDAVILGHCDSQSNLGIAKNYIEFLQSEGKEPNYATWGRLMKLFYHSYKKETLSEDDKSQILKFYRSLRSEHDILDPTTCENLVFGLCSTTEWKESLSLLEMIKNLATPTIQTYSAIIDRCFNELTDEALGWQLLEEMISREKQPHCDIFIAYFTNIEKYSKKFKRDVEKMLNYIGENDILVSQIVIDKLQEVLQKKKIKAHLTSITEKGACNKCGSHMEDIVISPKEFEELRTAFLDQVLIRKDMFLKTTPEELKEFLRYVDRTVPYDCVIDGLNVAFSAGTKKPSVFFAKLLSSVVEYFKRRNMKILLIGRKHMNMWPEREMSFIKRNTNFFLTGNLSYDDPFLLYATLKSGINTNFFSRDLMRSHLFLLDGRLKSIFRRWQQIHQFSLIYAGDNGNVLLKEPIQFHINAHKVDRTWHVPFKEQYMAKPGNSYKIPEKWLCLRL